MPIPSRLVMIVLFLHTTLLFILSIWLSYPTFDQPAFLGLLLHSFVACLLILLHVFQQWPRWLIWLQNYLGVAGWQMILLYSALGLVLLARLAAGDRVQANFPGLATVSWLVAITAVVWGAISWTKPEKPVAENAPVWWGEIIFLLFLTVLALLLRVAQLETIPPTLSGDEASAGLEGVRFLQGEITNLFTTGWFGFATFYFAVQSVGIELWGQTTAGLRVMSALAGALTIPAVYWLGRQTYGVLMGIATAVLLTFSHFHIHFSRIGLNNIWDGLFLALILLTLWQGWQTGRRGWFLWCGFLLGLSQYFYVSARIFPLVVLTWALWAGWQERARWRRNLPSLGLAALVAIVVYAPLALYFMQNPNIFQAPLNRVTIFGSWLEGEIARLAVSPLWVIGDQIRLSVLGITHEPLRMWYTPQMPLLRWPANWLFWLGVGLVLLRRELRGFLFLWPLAVSLLLGAFSQDAPASQRFIVVSVLAISLTAVPLALAVDWVGQLGLNWQRSLTAVGLAILLFVGMADVRFYFDELYDFYSLGGVNTEVATAVAHYLRDHPGGAQDVYFLGHPRMRYASHSTVPYLAPDMNGRDLQEPLRTPPEGALFQDTIFIFLPERGGELMLVEEAYPHGRVQEFRHPRHGLLFVSYEVTVDE